MLIKESLKVFVIKQGCNYEKYKYYSYNFIRFFVLIQSIVLPQSITWLGTLGGSESRAFDVSADGNVVVGYSRDNLGRFRAFRWTRTEGMVDLGTLGGNWSAALGVSANGDVIVGNANNYQGGLYACFWSDGLITSLDTINTVKNSATSISADGSVIVGSMFFHISPDNYHAFIWNSGTEMMDLGTLGGLNSVANDASFDGAIVVGGSQLSNRDWRAFRWVGGIMQDLGTIGWQSTANAISGNGLVVVGDCNQAKAFRWTEGDGMQDLGNLGKYDCSALDVTYDGSIIVGWAKRNTDDKVVAFIWSEQTGMKDLNSLYANQVGVGKHLVRAEAISNDGRYIVGYGYNDSLNRYEAFLLDTENYTGINEIVEIPSDFFIYQNYPNPFNPTTKISWQSPVSAHQSLRVYDVLGNEVAILVDEYKPAGKYEIDFTAADLSSGIYLIKLETDNYVKTKKMILIK